MGKKVSIHTTIEEGAKNILDKVGGKGGVGDLISKLVCQLDGGKMEQVIIDNRFSLPRTEEKLIPIGNDLITALQGGIYKNALTLIAGDTGTGKFSSIVNMILELSLSEKSVLLVTPKDKDKIELALKTIFVARNRKLPSEKNAITLDLKIMKPSSLHDLSAVLDSFTNKPILFLDHIEEMVCFDPQEFNKTEWQFFKSCLKRNKITAVITVSANKDTILSNAVLGFESIFYLLQIPALLNGRSKLVRHIITFKSPKGTIPPKEFLLGENWQIRLIEKNPVLMDSQNDNKRPEENNGKSESLKRIAESTLAVQTTVPESEKQLKDTKPDLESGVKREENLEIEPEEREAGTALVVKGQEIILNGQMKGVYNALKDGPLNMSEIGYRADIKSSGCLIDILDKLEKLGVIERDKSKKRIIVSLTDTVKDKQFIAASDPKDSKVFTEAERNFNDPELIKLFSGVNSLTEKELIDGIKKVISKNIFNGSSIEEVKKAIFESVKGRVNRAWIAEKKSILTDAEITLIAIRLLEIMKPEAVISSDNKEILSQEEEDRRINEFINELNKGDINVKGRVVRALLLESSNEIPRNQIQEKAGLTGNYAINMEKILIELQKTDWIIISGSNIRVNIKRVLDFSKESLVEKVLKVFEK